MEVAMDLCRLALFDVILYLDDSGSMSFEENGSRIGELQLLATEMSPRKREADYSFAPHRRHEAHRLQGRYRRLALRPGWYPGSFSRSLSLL